MAVWRCPYCATPQAESSRCWVCRRSTTSCATCRHFRRGIAGGLGVCGLDPRRPALAGTEMRACWTGATPPQDPADRDPVAVGPGRGPDRDAGWSATSGRRPRTFVLVDSAVHHASGPAGTAVREPAVEDPALVAAPARPAPAARRPVPGRWWLWGDPDPWPEP